MPPKYRFSIKTELVIQHYKFTKRFCMKRLRRDNSSKILGMIMIKHFLSLTSIYVTRFQSFLYFPRYGQDKHPL